MEASSVSDFNNHKISESEIITKILSGQKELFEILLRRNNQKLYRAIRSYIKDEHEIEDLMQNAHIKAYEKLSQFRFSSSYSTWLIRIGINEALARLKEKGKIININGEFQRANSNSILEMSDTTQLNPERKIMQQEAKLILETTIDQLPIKYKSVFILREVEELSTNETAECLGITVANVKVRNHRAKSILKEQLFNLTKNANIYEFGFSRCDRITENVMMKIL